MSDQKNIGESVESEVKEMSFLDHLEVLRWVLVRSSGAILIGAVVAFMFKKVLFDKILFAPIYNDFFTYKMFCRLGEKFNLPNLCFQEMTFTLQSLKFQEQFSMHIWISIVAGIILAFPFILWEIWKFISPGLYKNEKRNASLFIIVSSLLFMLGILFGYYIILPLSLNFLSNYTVSDIIQNNFQISSYFSILKSAVLASGVMFELPILIYFLSKFGIVTPQFLRTYRKHAIVIVLILAAIITPPDMVSQIIVSIPVFFLYEISILISAVVYKKKQREESS